MPITAATVVAGGNLLGGYLQGQAAKDAAGQTAGAMNAQAQAQLQTAQAAADAAKFRPVGITTNFGSSNFQFDPSGYLRGATYALSPELQAQQQQIMAGARTNLSDAQQLSALGRSYISANPQDVAQKWLSQQNALLQPSREQQRAQIQNSLFNTGRGGVSVAQGGGLGAANPEMQAYYNAIAQQDAQNALQAQQYGQQQLTFGQGLLTSAYAPYSNALGLASTVEQLGQSPLDIGAQLGGRTATAGANVGQSLMSGAQNAANLQVGAAKTLQAANSYSPLGSAISGLSSNPAFTNALGQYFGNQQYNQPQPGQYTPGSQTYVGPMPQQAGMFNPQPAASGATSDQYWL